MKKLFAGALALALAFCMPVHAQDGVSALSPCAANQLSVSNSSTNVQLSTCGPVVYLMNIGATEAFWTIGTASNTAATTAGNTTASYSIPSGAYIRINVPYQQSAGYYFAAITASSTTTIRIIQGNQP